MQKVQRAVLENHSHVMTSTASTPADYLETLPTDRKEAFLKLRQTLIDNLPTGFEETMQYGMLSYVVPHSIYPKGYHCKPIDALPFLSLASQKNNISLYHMGLYASQPLMDWFTSSWDAARYGKLDMGKSCIRLKKMDKIPYDLLGELCGKMSPAQWIELYESAFRR
jgi:hypothetical protein